MQKSYHWLLALIMCGAMGLALRAAETAPNTLSAAEKAAGWRLLFDGQTTDQWRSFGKNSFPAEGWEIEEGWLTKKNRARPGNIITRDQFTDFEFSWDWRLTKGANNGVKYFVVEARGNLGHEYQMLGDVGARPSKGGTASFYEVLPPKEHAPVKVAPDINTSRIVVQGNRVEHWLNGEKVVEYECGSDEVLAGVAKSKFKTTKDFGKKFTGHLMLTDHGSECSFRNVKIRELPAK